MKIDPRSVIALALVLVALVAVSIGRDADAAVTVVGAVGALILSALPAIARFSGKA